MRDAVGVPVYYSRRCGQRAITSGIPNRRATTTNGGGTSGADNNDDDHNDYQGGGKPTHDADPRTYNLPERFIHTNGNRRSGVTVWKVNKVSCDYYYYYYYYLKCAVVPCTDSWLRCKIFF